MIKMQNHLKPSKKVSAVALLLCLGFILLNPNAALAETVSPKQQKMVFEVYAGGIHAVQGTLDIDQREKGKYSITMFGKTRGFLGKLAPWNGTFESHGWRKTNGKDGVYYQPKNHKSIATWRDETDIKDYRYNKNGTFGGLYLTDTHKTNERSDVDAAVTEGTTDALSAALNVFNAYNQSGKCEGEDLVFDGKRRFRQVFVHQGEVQLTKSKYNIYEGPAAECAVEVIPAGGEWSSKPRGWLSIQEQGRERGLLPTVWIAKIAEDGSAVPVKIRVKTAYGTLFMHLAEYRSGDKTLIAKKRVKD